MVQDRVWNVAIGLSIMGLLALPATAMMSDRPSFLPQLKPAARQSLIPAPQPSLPVTQFTCPTTLQPLTIALLRDLPGYINRSTFRLASRQAEPTYAVVASQPDFMPLPTGSSEDQSPRDANLHQVFFTVLERQYVGKRVVEFQQFHWLFLARTTGGWRLALLFSRLGFYPSDRQPLTPPRESSQSATADAIRSWLRNCEAGSVKVLR